MKKRLIALTSILVALVIVFAGCASGRDEAMEEPQAVYEKTMISSDTAEEAGFGDVDDVEYETKEERSNDGGGDEITDFSEKIIYNVHTSVSVEDVQIAVDSVAQKVKALGGYISYSNIYNSGGYAYANVEIRIPSQNLSKMKEHTYTLGDVDDYTMSTENITESYYDIKGRLESAEKEEVQLLAVLEKAETIEDILLVREQLSYVQERIESYRGKMRLWDSLVDYSTVTYNIRPIPTLDNDDDSPRLIKLDETWRSMKKGFKNSAIAVANFFSYLFSLLAVMLIPLVILGVLAIIIIAIVKQSRKRKKAKEQNKE